MEHEEGSPQINAMVKHILYGEGSPSNNQGLPCTVIHRLKLDKGTVWTLEANATPVKHTL